MSHHTAVQDELRVVSTAAATSVSPPPAKGAKGMLPWQVDVTMDVSAMVVPPPALTVLPTA